jgi:hypothetical protein
MAKQFNIKEANEARIRLSIDFSYYKEKGVFTSRKDNENPEEQIKEEIIYTLPLLAQQIQLVRNGGTTADGKIIKPNDITFENAIQRFYNADLKSFLKAVGIDYSKSSLADVAYTVSGVRNLQLSDIKDMFKKYNQFAATVATTDYNEAYRFLIPEIIMQVMRTAYEHTAKYPNWIAGTNNVSVRSGIFVPRIEGDSFIPTEVPEGMDIPSGDIKVGQKSVTVKKYGTGFSLTKELLEETKIEMLSTALSKIGSRINVGEDIKAVSTLFNGEQADLSESAPIVGVNDTAKGFQHIDLDEIETQLSWLGLGASRLIGNKADLLTDLNESKPNRDRQTIRQYVDKQADLWKFPTGQIMFLNASRCMYKLQYGSFLVENDYKMKNQVYDLYASFYTGFYIGQRDARVIVDKAQDFETLNWSNYPYMDIESYLASTNGFPEF